MKKILFIISLLTVANASAALKINPVTGRLDVVGLTSLSTNTAGASAFIWNTNTLQSGSTYYVSSGTVQGQLSVISPPCTGGFGCTEEKIYMFTRTSTFQPFSYIKAHVTGNSGLAIVGADQSGGNYADVRVVPIAAGVSKIVFEDINNFEQMALYMGQNGGLIISTSIFIADNYAMNFGNRFGNYVGLKSPGSLTKTNIYNLPSSSGTQGLAIISDGHNNLSFGLSSAAVSGVQYAIPVLDGNGSLTESAWQISPSLLGLTNLAFGDNFFVTQHAGIGLGATFRYYSPTLATFIDFGTPDTEFAETYRIDWPNFKLGAYETWTSTGPTGYRVQLQNTKILISTSSLQPGATVYLSTGTIIDLNTTRLKFADGTVMTSSPTANPYRDYWWVGSGTLPLEPRSDAVAAINITTGTFVDVLTADYDSATEECRGLNFVIPTEVNTATSVALIPYWMSVSTTINNVVWKLYQNNGTGQADKIDVIGQSHTWPAVTVASSTGTLNVSEYDLAVSSLTWTADHMVDARICRDGANASDTMSGDAKLNGFRIRIPIR